MKPRPVEIVICLETTATLGSLRHRYYASICDALTMGGEEGKIVRVDVFSIKRLKAGTPEGGAG